jgi:hypothetical protein
MGKGYGEAHAFFSYQPRSIYQYELYSPDFCDDPRNDDDPACSAPDVFRTDTDPLEATSRFSFQTLPNVFAEMIGGGNATYSWSHRTRVGVTGYASQVDWLVDGIDLDFQEWSAMPYGGGFGAIGVNAAHGIGNTDILAEVTRSFDHSPRIESSMDEAGSDLGGGFAGIVRSVTAWDKNELEASVRYYDTAFQNPHARPISAADEYDGLRARDEAGARLRYTTELSKRFRVRSNLDYWRAMSDDADKLKVFVRGDVDMNDQIRWGLWTQYQDKDLGLSGREQCFEISVEEDENGEPIPCAGQKLQVTGRLRVAPSKTTWFDLQYQHEILDSGRYDDKYRQDSSLVGIITTKPHKDFRLRARTRFLYEDISDSGYLEKSLWTYADLTYRLRRKDKLRFRYDIFMYLDDRASTADRQPNPEHWVWAEYLANF